LAHASGGFPTPERGRLLRQWLMDVMGSVMLEDDAELETTFASER
jgi:hypothetical protein